MNYEKDMLDKVSYDLLVNGYSIIENYLNTEDDIFEKLSEIHNKEKNINLNSQYQGGICKRYENITRIDNDHHKVFNNWLSDPLIKKIAFKYLGSKNLKIDVFQTLDTSKTVHIAQKPHFDRIPTLKFMLYLNDLSSENGPFCLSPGSHHWVRNNFPLPRAKFSDTKFFEKSRNLPYFINDGIIPILGKAGQLLIFHTDCVHHQGIVKSGECKIFRAHFRNSKQYFSNENSSLKNKISKIKNLINFI